MAEDTKQPGSDENKTPDASASDSSGQPQSPKIETASADAEKASMVEEAKARVAAVKESLAAQPQLPLPAGAPKPPVKKKEEGPKPTDASSHPLVKKLKGKFGEAIGEASSLLVSFPSLSIQRANCRVCDFLRTDSETPFNYLSDLTCVHYPIENRRPLKWSTTCIRSQQMNASG